jgi:hypothetical protein
MSNDTANTGTGGSKSSAAADAPRFSREELAERYPVHVLAGALEGHRKQTFTADEVESAITKWRKREVEVEMAEPDPDPGQEA